MGERLVQASLCTWRASHCTQAVAALAHGQACGSTGPRTGMFKLSQTPTTTLSSERDAYYWYVNTYFPTTMPKSDNIKLQGFANLMGEKKWDHILICIFLIKVCHIR